MSKLTAKMARLCGSEKTTGCSDSTFDLRYKSMLILLNEEARLHVAIKIAKCSIQGKWHINHDELTEHNEASLDMCDKFKRTCTGKKGQWHLPPTGSLCVKLPPPAALASGGSSCSGGGGSSLFRHASRERCVADAVCNVLSGALPVGAHKALCSMSAGDVSVLEFCEAAKGTLKQSGLEVSVGFKDAGEETPEATFAALKALAGGGPEARLLVCPCSYFGPPSHAVGVRGVAGGGAVILDSHISPVPIPFTEWTDL
jgi:hypothetical protein